jgi:rRNA maturation protein Nop10
MAALSTAINSASVGWSPDNFTGDIIQGDDTGRPINQGGGTNTATGSGVPGLGPDEAWNTGGSQSCYIAYTPSPTPSPPTDVSAVGDPHLSNVRGDHFDIYEPGKFVLLQVPQGAEPASTMLLVDADAVRMRDPCSVYFQAVTVSGSWTNRSEPIRFSADPHGKPRGADWKRWMQFGTVELKVTYHKKEFEYLNVYAKGVGQTGHAVGGLLGLDEHAAIATRPPHCSRHRAMMVSSVAEARP